ncbi:hypothetical protein YDYSY3_57670 [Paenibacillus chitinolyticus]|uniref:hypothetical protein n=1 Tax=Paenibacillus chitinolyticus TaxID=79263 RepID=UPI0026E4CF6B|nr:hypothetical protein [Paenibacillus chitinolyticus]GKS14767.1 hypothetical protein YDYSY3_57670 [Paenibacillus chitinolyticus]
MGRTYGDLKGVTIKLSPDQKFFREIENDCSLLLVDEIHIVHEADQMYLSGTHFSVDYESGDISKTQERGQIYFSTKYEQSYFEGDE